MGEEIEVEGDKVGFSELAFADEFGILAVVEGGMFLRISHKSLCGRCQILLSPSHSVKQMEHIPLILFDVVVGI